MTKSAQVPGQYLGYSLQTNRMLAYLLNSTPGSSVSLEVFEDVGVTHKSGRKIAEQSKSTLASNPVADGSEQLWKTFANWGDACKSKLVDPKRCDFRIFVSEAKTAPLAKELSDAHIPAQISAAIQKAFKVLRESKSAGVAKQFARIKQIPKETFELIVANFTLEFGSGSSKQVLLDLFRAKFVGEDVVEDVVKLTLGWVKLKTDELIEKKLPAVIHYDEFRREAVSFIRKIDTARMLFDFAGEPSETEIKQGLLRMYVRQLDAVEADDEDKIRAVRSFLRANANIIEWSNRSMIHRSDVAEFESKLRTQWNNTKKQQDLDHSSEAPVTRWGGRMSNSKIS